MKLAQTDKQTAGFLQQELERSRHGLEMIPSENYVSEAVLEALGSVGTNKYSEGYPGRRYYGGCEFVDAIENLAIERAKKLFGVDMPMSSPTPVLRPIWPSASPFWIRAIPFWAPIWLSAGT